MKIRFASATTLAAAAALFMVSASVHAVDDDAAKKLFKSNDCTKCHAPDKNKKGPSLKTTAKKYAGDASAEAKLIKHITTGPKVKLEDGTMQDHKIIDTTDQAQLKNLVEWILAQH